MVSYHSRAAQHRRNADLILILHFRQVIQCHARLNRSIVVVVVTVRLAKLAPTSARPAAISTPHRAMLSCQSVRLCKVAFGLLQFRQFFGGSGALVELRRVGQLDALGFRVAALLVQQRAQCSVHDKRHVKLRQQELSFVKQLAQFVGDWQHKGGGCVTGLSQGKPQTTGTYSSETRLDAAARLRCFRRIDQRARRIDAIALLPTALLAQRRSCGLGR